MTTNPRRLAHVLGLRPTATSPTNPTNPNTERGTMTTTTPTDPTEPTELEPTATADERLTAAVERLGEIAESVTLTTYDGETVAVNLRTGEQGVDDETAEAAVRRAIDDVVDGELTDEQRQQVAREFEAAIARTARARHEKRVDAEQQAVSLRLFAVEPAKPQTQIVKSSFRLKAPGVIGEIDSEGDVSGAARIAVASGEIDPVDLVHLPIGSRVRIELDAYVVGFNPTAELEDEDGNVRDGKIAHVLEAGRVRIRSIRRKGERASTGEVKVGPAVVKLPDVNAEQPEASS